MIYDCFLYYDEDMLLDIRLNTLNDVVDYFVIVESTHTFTGKPKKLNFDISKFEKFKDKIIYVIYNDLPKLKNGIAGEYDAWKNEAATRNAIMRGLKNAKDNDIILISDVDEIFRPEVIKNINPKEGANKQVISSQADSLIKISRIWADFFPANTSNQPV
ncbi:hypothetical protein ACLH01_02985, partial [Enterobacter cloacae]